MKPKTDRTVGLDPKALGGPATVKRARYFHPDADPVELRLATDAAGNLRLTLAEHLKLSPERFRSVVFFIGDCEFKTALPGNVLTRGLVSHIQSLSTPCCHQQQLAQ